MPNQKKKEEKKMILQACVHITDQKLRWIHIVNIVPKEIFSVNAWVWFNRAEDRKVKHWICLKSTDIALYIIHL